MNKINGNAIAETILSDVSIMAPVLQKRVCFIQFGNDAASTAFIARKQRVALQMGIHTDVIQEKAITTTDEALAVLEEAVTQGYDGIVVQLPLPFSIDTDSVLNAIPIEQDIDVLSSDALQAFVSGQSMRMPPVAGAVNAVITTEQIDLLDKSIVIIGKGRLVGAPIALLFERSNIAYEVIDSHTPSDRRSELLLNADVIISGIGDPHSIKASMIKDGVVLIDAGTSEHKGLLVGDIDPECYDKVQTYTPTPGGIGPITVALLLKNLFEK